MDLPPGVARVHPPGQSNLFVLCVECETAVFIQRGRLSVYLMLMVSLVVGFCPGHNSDCSFQFKTLFCCADDNLF